MDVRVQPVSGLGGTVTFGTPFELRGTWVIGQAWLSNGTTSVFGGRCSSSFCGGIYRFSDGVISGTTGTTGFEYGGLALLSDTLGYIGTSGDTNSHLVTFNPGTSTAGATVGSFTVGPYAKNYATPVLGASRPSSAKRLGYAVSPVASKGPTEIMVFDSVSGTLEWKQPLMTATSPSLVSHPTLDCSRTNPATGILYVPYTNGTLQAIVVDSPGLDLTAVWPKYQRSAGNAGNMDPRFPIGTSGCAH